MANNVQQLTRLTDEDIEKGVNEGKYFMGDQVIRDNKGRIVKHNPIQPHVENLPPSIVQINNTVIYVADIPKMLRAIGEKERKSLERDMIDIYAVVSDAVKHYDIYQDNLDDLTRILSEHTPIFENRIDEILKLLFRSILANGNHHNDYNRDDFLQKVDAIELHKMDFDFYDDSLNAYIDILIINTVANFIKYKEKSNLEVNITKKIQNIRYKLQKIFNALTMNDNAKWLDRLSEVSTKLDRESFQNSIYPIYLLNKEFKGIDLDRIAANDPRIDNGLATLVDFLKDNFIDYSWQDIKINIKPKMRDTDVRHKYILLLINLFEKIRVLEGYKNECNIVSENADENIFSTILAFKHN
ncbi:hypothetical protein AB7W23_21595 [Providencia rettgeri]